MQKLGAPRRQAVGAELRAWVCAVDRFLRSLVHLRVGYNNITVPLVRS
jgi:hypothetical protein